MSVWVRACGRCVRGSKCESVTELEGDRLNLRKGCGRAKVLMDGCVGILVYSVAMLKCWRKQLKNTKSTNEII